MTNDQREIPRKKRIVWYLHRYHGIRTYEVISTRRSTRPHECEHCEIYRRHTQSNAIDFINYVVDKFPDIRE